jgi:hypothetical protein
MIRRKKSYNIGDSLQPFLESLTDLTIQNAIKSRIDKTQFRFFLEKKMNEDTIVDFQRLIDIEGTLYTDIDTSKRKYLYDLLMAVMYEELLSFSDLVDIITSQGNSSVDILEKMIILEYDLYFLDGSIGTTQEFNKVYIIDNVRDIFHSTNEKISYKDLDNLKEELDKILNGASKPTEIPSDFYIIEDGETIFNYGLLFRVNGKLASIEGSNTAKYSFLLNYNTTSSVTDRSLARKYEALTSGYYYKNQTKVYFDGISEYSYYPLLSDTYDADFEEAHVFLTQLWDKMIDGTINY